MVSPFPPPSVCSPRYLHRNHRGDPSVQKCGYSWHYFLHTINIALESLSRHYIGSHKCPLFCARSQPRTFWKQDMNMVFFSSLWAQHHFLIPRPIIGKVKKPDDLIISILWNLVRPFTVLTFSIFPPYDSVSFHEERCIHVSSALAPLLGSLSTWP